MGGKTDRRGEAKRLIIESGLCERAEIKIIWNRTLEYELDSVGPVACICEQGNEPPGI
jgi:hypothetical protein